MESHLQHGVGLQQAVFDGLHLVTGRTGDGVILQDLLGRLRLPGTALAGDQDALVLPLCPHGAVRVICHRVARGAERERRNQGDCLKMFGDKWATKLGL